MAVAAIRDTTGSHRSVVSVHSQTAARDANARHHEEPNMSQLLISLLAAAGIAFAGAANAADTSGMSRDAYKADKDKIETQYKADKGQCTSMSGNAKDICNAEARAKEKVAKA